MMQSNYEKHFLLNTFIFIFLLFLILFFVTLFIKKIDCYEMINGNVRKNDLIELYVSDSQLKKVYRSEYLFIEGKKYRYSLEQVDLKVLYFEKNYYSFVLISVDKLKGYSDNQNISIAIFDKKIKFIKILEIIWEGD